MQHLTECLADSVVGPGTIVHRRTLSAKPDKPHPGDGAWVGTPTSRWPACMPRPHDWTKRADQWRELSAGRAMELGAVPCTERACTEAVTA